MRHKATLSDDGTIALPPEIRRLLGVEQGGNVVFEVSESGVQVTAEEASDPFSRYRGIWRGLGPATVEEIIAEQREMRGWDEYDYWLADNDDSH